MTTSLLCVLLYAIWTVCPVIFGVGAYRVLTVLTGKRAIDSFPADTEHGGPDWYRRVNRAHLNCVENLPVFACVIFVGFSLDVQSQWWTAFAITTIVSRILQTLVHVLSISPIAIQCRFALFSIQLACIAGLSALIVLNVTT